MRATILCDREFTITDNDIKALSGFNRTLSGLTLFTDGVYQVSQEELAKIRVVLPRINEFVHYELAFDAKSKMLDGDGVGALISAVTAHESVHSAFVQYEFEKKLISLEDRKINLINKYIKSMGISDGNYLTLFLFMDEFERPSADLIENCGKAISVRNKFIHALKDKKGKHFSRTLKNAEISSAYKAVLDVYESYVSALEKRIYSGESDSTTQ